MAPLSFCAAAPVTVQRHCRLIPCKRCAATSPHRWLLANTSPISTVQSLASRSEGRSAALLRGPICFRISPSKAGRCFWRSMATPCGSANTTTRRARKRRQRCCAQSARSQPMPPRSSRPICRSSSSIRHLPPVAPSTRPTWIGGTIRCPSWCWGRREHRTPQPLSAPPTPMSMCAATFATTTACSWPARCRVISFAHCSCSTSVRARSCPRSRSASLRAKTSRPCARM